MNVVLRLSILVQLLFIVSNVFSVTKLAQASIMNDGKLKLQKYLKDIKVLLLIAIICKFFLVFISKFIVKSLGCWGESDSDRAIYGDYGTLDKQACYDKAKSLGYSVFAINNGTKCYTSPIAWSTYKKYGPVESSCNGSLSNDVYLIISGSL